MCSFQLDYTDVLLSKVRSEIISTHSPGFFFSFSSHFLFLFGLRCVCKLDKLNKNGTSEKYSYFKNNHRPMCLVSATRNSEQLCLTCLSMQSYGIEVWSEKSFILEKYWSYHTKIT